MVGDAPKITGYHPKIKADMHSNNINLAERLWLQFPQKVKQYFLFLEQRYNFRCIQEEITFVRYKRSDIHIDVYHGRGSFEAGVEFGQISAGESYSLEMLVTLLDEGVAKDFWPRFSRTPEKLDQTLQNAAHGLLKYGISILEGNYNDIFDKLDELGEKRITEFNLKSNINHYRPRGYEAFKAGDYAKAVEFYSQIEEALTPVEKKKLELAKKRSS